MPEQKTKPTQVSAESFLADVADEKVRDDCQALVKMMRRITRPEPTMWGSSIVGFGKYHYKYESGREGYSCFNRFFAKKAKHNPVCHARIFATPRIIREARKYKAGKGCIYIKN